MRYLAFSVLLLLITACGGGTEDGYDSGNTPDAPGNISFSSETYSVTENSGTLQILLKRENGTLGNVSVTFSVESATASNNADYSALQQGVIIFGEGETTKTILVTLINDDLVEGDENIVFALSNPTANATIVSPSSTTVNIIDDESPGVIQFATNAITRNETAGTVQLDVQRSGGTASGVFVDYVITAGTATAGLDYEDLNLTGTLAFGAGETAKTISVTLIDDFIVEGTERLNVSLSNPVLATIGTRDNITLNILDNDALPTPGSSISFIESPAGQLEEYAVQTNIPGDFGAGEFTLQMWVKLDNSYPVGSTDPNTGDQVLNWSDSDITPYSVIDWWWRGNFLLDGHNNLAVDGTFSVQIYGGGRVRWLFGDGVRPVGNYWAVQASDTNSTPSLLDNEWHQISLVRRWYDSSSSQLELWIDGTLIDTEISSARTNMRTYWDTWDTYYAEQRGWFWGVEKNTISRTTLYEDYKGLVDEIRFWERALTTEELSTTFYQSYVTGSEPGLIGLYRLDEGTGTTACDELNPHCINMMIPTQGWAVWESENAPLL